MFCVKKAMASLTSAAEVPGANSSMSSMEQAPMKRMYSNGEAMYFWQKGRIISWYTDASWSP